MEIGSSIFQDLENFGKGKFFKMAMEKLWIFVWKVLEYPRMLTHFFVRNKLSGFSMDVS